MSKYESISFYGDSWEAKTSGCGCCVHTDNLNGMEAVNELLKLSTMYSDISKRYAEMAEMAGKYNIPILKIVWDTLKGAESRLEAAHDYEEGKPCGTWQKEMFEIGYFTLEDELSQAKYTSDMFPHLADVAKVFGWR